jgi:proline iminopeptidase
LRPRPLAYRKPATIPSPFASVNDLNPKGIKVAGIQMIPVVGGKYNVWTKQIGTGNVKVLLLHGGPGGPHEYLEAMESLLPRASQDLALEQPPKRRLCGNRHS